MSDIKEVDSSYKNTIKNLRSQRGSYKDLSYMPVFRASGIFYVAVDEGIDTCVSFMNYWREKNHIDRVGALITLRDSEGEKVLREYFPLENFVYRLSARELLDSAEPFSGSLEVEIFSAEDLKFQFPALMVFYETDKGISFVHTNQRIYNNAEDRQRAECFNEWQTGFDLHSSKGLEPFVFCVNGPEAAEETKVELKIYNCNGEIMDNTIHLGSLPPYGSRSLNLLSYPKISDFLDSKPGFCKLNIGLKNIHLRLACGNSFADKSWLSVTHSYFDTNNHNDYYEVEDSSHSPCFVPFNLVEGMDVDLVFYPIFSPSVLSFSLECFDSKGKQRSWIDLETKFNSTGTGIYKIDIREILKSHNIAEDEGLYCMHINPQENKIPARITYGLNYRRGAKLGCNISNSALMKKSFGMGARTYRWGPISIQEGGVNHILVSLIKTEQNIEESSDFKLTLYDSKNIVLSKQFTLANSTGINICADKLLKDAEYQPDSERFLWFVLESPNPCYECNVIHVSKDGFVGGDHAF